jgi:hypothetical protein
MLTLIGLAALKLANDEITIAGNELNEMSSFYSSEAGLEIASAAIQSYYDTYKAPPPAEHLPSGSQNIGDAASVAYVTTDDGPADLRRLTTGDFAGLHAQVKLYTIESIGTSLIDGSQVRLSQSFECANVPLFQFAVFYMNDLYTQPADNMSISGRVHVNGSMFLRSSNRGKQLAFDGKVTCSGNIYEGFGGSGSVGDILFRSGTGGMVSMYQDGQWVDAGDPDWYNKASQLWRGQVKDKAFGQSSLNIPLSSGSDPYQLIQRSSGGNSDSYEEKATLKIIDGVPYTKIGGVWQDVSAMLPAGTVTQDATTSFYDNHEYEWVSNTQVDLGLLSGSGYFPDNGVIYISDRRSSGATMNGATLVNGSEIAGGLTIACENPLYVQGDFNTVDKKPAAALCDAITFLSNGWDKNYATPGTGYRYRTADPTAYNISFITGDGNHTAREYNGGLANLPRYLEHWNGKAVTIRGSMIEGWRSRQATEDWRYLSDPSPYYSAPTRDYGFDTDLNDPGKLPPETPSVRVFQRTGWQQNDVDIAAN